MLQPVCLLKPDDWLVLHDPKLADAVVYVDLGIPHGENRHVPLVVIAAV